MTEHALAGGNVAAAVVRVGDTVRKPAGFWPPSRVPGGGTTGDGRCLSTYASAGFEPLPGARWNAAIPPGRRDLICHHDLAPWNLVTGADRWVFIDWDRPPPRCLAPIPPLSVFSVPQPRIS